MTDPLIPKWRAEIEAAPVHVPPPGQLFVLSLDVPAEVTPLHLEFVCAMLRKEGHEIVGGVPLLPGTPVARVYVILARGEMPERIDP